jgi:Mg/Co/Ni transporter MgtE
LKNPDLKLALVFIDTHPNDAAGILELMPQGDVIGLLRTLTRPQASSMLIRMLPSHAARLCTLLEAQLAAELLLEAANINRIVAIMRFVNSHSRDSLLAALPLETSAACRLLLGYTQDDVGAWMNPQIIMLSNECVVADALARLSSEPATTDSSIIHIVDRDLQLQGIVKIPLLLHADKDKPVIELADRADIAISGRASLTSVQNHPGWNRRDILTVINRSHQPVGILHHSDLRRALERGGRDESVNTVEEIAPVSLYRTYGNVLVALLNVLNDISGGMRKP